VGYNAKILKEKRTRHRHSRDFENMERMADCFTKFWQKLQVLHIFSSLLRLDLSFCT